MSDPSKTIYGELSSTAPKELRAGRYVLDGTAIADEMQAPAPDGSPYLGITQRQYDPGRKTWIVEYLNVSGSFLRKQVNAAAGSVEVDGRNVTVASESPGVTIREHYVVPDDSSFTYRLDVSNDGGRSWKTGQVEMIFRRMDVVRLPVTP